MTIRDMQKYVSSIADWSCFDGIFRNKYIKVGDLDGAVEINGHLLILETKGYGVSIPRGQQIMFENLASHRKASTLVLWGDSARWKKYRYYQEGTTGFLENYCDLETVIEIMQQWETAARRNLL